MTALGFCIRWVCLIGALVIVYHAFGWLSVLVAALLHFAAVGLIMPAETEGGE